jgi:SAM-dependent methyltransferase
MSPPPTTEHIDSANAAFWDELCGSQLAAASGITQRSPDALAKFDSAYLSFYPYLLDYVQPDRLKGLSVLEIGLGYGTLGNRIAGAGAKYHGVDLAQGPVEMMAYRLRTLGLSQTALRGNAYTLPFRDRSFEFVVSIGCLHHTGQLEKAVAEIRRVLKPNGAVLVMLYNAFSYRQWLRSPLETFKAFVRESRGHVRDHRATERQRRAYDANLKGVAAPETVFVSRDRVRELFREYSDVRIHSENCGDLFPGGRRLSVRRRCLGPLGRMAGLDLYIAARRRGIE